MIHPDIVKAKESTVSTHTHQEDNLFSGEFKKTCEEIVDNNPNTLQVTIINDPYRYTITNRVDCPDTHICINPYHNTHLFFDKERLQRWEEKWIKKPHTKRSFSLGMRITNWMKWVGVQVGQILHLKHILSRVKLLKKRNKK